MRWIVVVSDPSSTPQYSKSVVSENVSFPKESHKENNAKEINLCCNCLAELKSSF
jgi:hypothetical protein